MMPPRVAVLQLFHEASSIAPRLVTRDEFLARHHMRGPKVAAAFGHTQNWMGGVLSALSAHGITPEIGLCTAALPGGPVAAEDFAVLLDELGQSLDEILARGPLTHLFLLLHGALLARGRDDPEGDIAAAMRARVGPDTRIAVPLDFHANPGPGLLGAADIVLGGKLYPHTDTHARGARLVELALGAERLVTHHIPLGLRVPMPNQQTTHGPFAELATLSDTLEGPPVADVSLLGGFPFSQAPFRGTSLLITAATGADIDAVAHRMRAEVDARRADLLREVPDPAAAETAIRRGLSQGRVVLADVGDNPGGGGTGEVTALLPILLDLGRPFGFGFLVAPDLVRGAVEGRAVELPTPKGPISAMVERRQTIRYRNTGPMMRGEELFGGDGAVLAIGPSRILVSSLRVQAYDANAFRAMGVTPEAMDILAIKSSAHFRASYTPLATGGIVLVDSGGLSSPRRAPAF
ncbi:MAG: M81 family metallopeptidase [Tropicimonas sp.]|uniref:M81 family metallopeptidase n=1 Tax=Tropicimonas sp. TaxID=2067044 RepID=UPI003A83591A